MALLYYGFISCVIFIALFCISFLEEKYSPRALIVKKCVYSQC